MSEQIAFIDLAAQQRRIGPRIEQAMLNVVRHGGYIMGPEVGELEAGLSDFSEIKHALSCANGTDALALPLMAWETKSGDAIFCPSFTFAATAEVVAWFDATPVFVDVLPGTFNMDPAGLRRAIEQVLARGDLTPKVVIAVDLFGQMADYPAIRAICDEFELKLISDAAQGFGATLDGKMSGAWADVVATSFFPAKPLGCYGDGGAVFCHNDELASIIQSLRVHGKGDDKYDNVRIGMNGRLDTIQAAVLLEKLAVFPDEIEARNQVAQRYGEQLGDVATVPAVPEGYRSTWAQYTLMLKPGQRDSFAKALKDEGVPTAIYYPKPLHRQTAYRNYPVEGNGLPVSDTLAEIVVSLPMHPYLDESTQDWIIGAARRALNSVAS